MTNEYYGVQRSKNSLTHYGIKGMKWGVQKAKEKGNGKKLDRQYAKANKKLAKLSDRADRDLQFKISDRLNKTARTAVGVSGLGALSAGGHALYPGKGGVRGFAASGLLTAGALGTAVGTKAVSLKARYNASTRGHAKAVAKRDAFKNAMDESFKNTKYDQNMTNKKVKHSDLDDPNSLAHYGIKGMKWGVQKAKAAGSDYKLGKQFMKAQRKLEKLNKKANASEQRQMASKHLKKAGLAGVDTGLAGGVGGLAGLSSYAQAATTGRVRLGSLGLAGLGAGAAAVGAGRTAYHLGKGIKHKIQSSYAYNRRATTKRDAFKREMDNAFRGTKYGKKRR